MTIHFAEGGPQRKISEETKREAVHAAVQAADDLSRVLALPPDATRIHSDAGTLTRMLYEAIGQAECFEVMPALGTHFPMSTAAIQRMFGRRIPLKAFKEHRWRKDLVRLGAVPAEFVHKVSEGVLPDMLPDYDIPVELNRRLAGGDYTAVFSIGQVVPHEVVGMANGYKNLLIGAGGPETINKSHFLGAVYGMERMMGRADTPVRAVLNYGHDQFLGDLGELYILTVMEPSPTGPPLMRGIYVGEGREPFRRAAELSRRVNVTLLDEPLEKVLVYLEPEEFKSTWLGNKAVYRTRMALADGGELIVIAPAVATFGEDPEIDRLIRKHGYRGTSTVLGAVGRDPELRENLSAAAHLIHGSSEGRFQITYATDPALLSPEEVRGVGFEWRHLTEVVQQYQPETLSPGENDGLYFVPCPGLGLWAAKEKFTG